MTAQVTFETCNLIYCRNTKCKRNSNLRDNQVVLLVIKASLSRFQTLGSINHLTMGRWGMCQCSPLFAKSLRPMRQRPDVTRAVRPR